MGAPPPSTAALTSRASSSKPAYRVVDAACEKRSITLSSNLNPAGFDELLPKTNAKATVDRLLHHAHRVLTAGDSTSEFFRRVRPSGRPLGET